jgi:hypothetical protein
MTSERQRLHRAVFKTRGSQRGYAGEEVEKPKGEKRGYIIWLVVSTPLKNSSQLG